MITSICPNSQAVVRALRHAHHLRVVPRRGRWEGPIPLPLPFLEACPARHAGRLSTTSFTRTTRRCSFAVCLEDSLSLPTVTCEVKNSLRVKSTQPVHVKRLSRWLNVDLAQPGLEPGTSRSRSQECLRLDHNARVHLGQSPPGL